MSAYDSQKAKAPIGNDAPHSSPLETIKQNNDSRLASTLHRRAPESNKENSALTEITTIPEVQPHEEGPN